MEQTDAALHKLKEDLEDYTGIKKEEMLGFLSRGKNLPGDHDYWKEFYTLARTAIIIEEVLEKAFQDTDFRRFLSKVDSEEEAWWLENEVLKTVEKLFYSYPFHTRFFHCFSFNFWRRRFLNKKILDFLYPSMYKQFVKTFDINRDCFSLRDKCVNKLDSLRLDEKIRRGCAKVAEKTFVLSLFCLGLSFLVKEQFLALPVLLSGYFFGCSISLFFKVRFLKGDSYVSHFPYYGTVYMQGRHLRQKKICWFRKFIW